MIAAARIVLSENQSQRSPSSSVYSRQPRNSAIRMRPGRSKARSSDEFGLSTSISDHTVAATKTPGHDIDEKQPVPRIGVGQVAADGRTDGRRQIEDQRDQHHDDGELARREHGVDHRKHRRDHRPAEKPLHDAKDDHRAEAGGGGAQRARHREADRRADEQHPRRQSAATKSRTAGSSPPRR